jgi:hypothetical protein
MAFASTAVPINPGPPVKAAGQGEGLGLPILTVYPPSN